MSKTVGYKWLVAIVVTFNSFMFYMDATIVNVALPTVGSLFHASTTTTGWIVTGYLLSLAMVIPVSGWLGDRYGAKRIFLLGLALFTAGSALCALAWNVEALVVFRIVQGVGAGVLSPVGSAMLYRAFPPEERARVAAFVVVPTVIAPTIGPIVGGYLVQYAGWSWIFLLNLPFGIVGIIMAAAVLKEQVQRSSGPFDVPGFVAGTVAVGALIYALQEVGRRGVRDPRVEVAVGAGMTALILFVILELRGAYPMLNVKLFADRLFASGTATSFFVQMLFVWGAQLRSTPSAASWARARGCIHRRVLAARMAAHNSAPGNPATAPGAWAAFHETFGATVLLAIVGMGAALLVSDRLAQVSRGRMQEQGRQQ